MLHRLLCSCVIITFLFTSLVPFHRAYADELPDLPQPGTMVNLSPAYEPVLIKGLKVHPENPFLFDFIIDSGNTPLSSPNALIGDPAFKQESSKLIKYFLAALTIPEKDLWVNLSPYEKDRIIAPNLGQTEMGRDMLAQDYILKQLTASLIYPEKHLGKTFWDAVYAKARQMYGTTQIPVDTFNKVWIVADKADVFEHGNVAYITGAHLKVMLEEDYMALQKHVSVTSMSLRGAEGDEAISKRTTNDMHVLANQIIRKIILPQIEKEVNTGKNFAPLRQMFYSMILASWYKMALKDAVLTQIYGNQSKVKAGVNQADPKMNEEIFQRYLKAYKKGVFNYIKEEPSSSSPGVGGQEGEMMPRKYFSGGLEVFPDGDPTRVVRRHQAWPGDGAMTGNIFVVSANTSVLSDAAMSTKDQIKAHLINFLPPNDNLAYLISNIFYYAWSILGGQHPPNTVPKKDIEELWQERNRIWARFRSISTPYEEGGPDHPLSDQTKDYFDQFNLLLRQDIEYGQRLILFLKDYQDEWTEDGRTFLTKEEVITKIQRNIEDAHNFLDGMDLLLNPHKSDLEVSQVISRMEKLIFADYYKSRWHFKIKDEGLEKLNLFSVPSSQDLAYAVLTMLMPLKTIKNLSINIHARVEKQEGQNYAVLDVSVPQIITFSSSIDKKYFNQPHWIWDQTKALASALHGDFMQLHDSNGKQTLSLRFPIKTDAAMAKAKRQKLPPKNNLPRSAMISMEEAKARYENAYLLNRVRQWPPSDHLQPFNPTEGKLPDGIKDRIKSQLMHYPSGLRVPINDLITYIYQTIGRGDVTHQELIDILNGMKAWKRDEGNDDFWHSSPLLGKKILVLDDQAGDRKYFENLLSSYGVMVEVLESAQEAIDSLDNGVEYDLILTDLDMSRMEVMDLAKNIKDRDLNTKVIVMTDDFATRQSHLIEALGYKVISKTISPDEMQSFLEAQFDEAMVINKTVNGKYKDLTTTQTLNGGIDLNRSHMHMNVRKEGQGVQMQFDPAMVERIRREGFDGLDFQIERIVPMADLPLWLGLKAGK